jgi:N-acetylmuramoyl-L-alanine amidase
MRICIDPGHGGTKPGAVANGIIEKEVNLIVSMLVRDMLHAHGIEVLMTRTEDRDVTLKQRTELANSKNADAFVSIHHNGTANTKDRGIEIYHSIVGGEGLRLAYLIHECYRALILELPSRGIKTRKGSDGRDYYHVIRETKMPAVITEGGFITNPEDAALIKTKSFQERQAQAISQGIMLWGEKNIMPEAPEWKKVGLKWLEENGFITPGRWQAEDVLDMGTLGNILMQMIITGKRGEK